MAELVRYIDPDATGLGTGLSWIDAYTSLNAWHTGEVANYDLVTAGNNMVVYLRSLYGTADTDKFTLDGWILSATNDLVFDQETYNPHRGYWNTDVYRLDVDLVSNADVGFYVRDEFVSFKGMQVRVTCSAALSTIGAIAITGTLTTNAVTNIERCLIVGNISGAANSCYGLWQNNDSTLNAKDNIITGFINGANTDLLGMYIANASADGDLYNNTIDNCYTNVNNASGSMIAVNNMLTNSGAASPVIGTFAAGTDYNLTDAASIGYTVTGAGNVNDVLNATIAYKDAANIDYRKIIEDTDAIGAGVGPTADVSVSITDIALNTRSGATTDIGADIFVTGGRNLTTLMINALASDSVEFYHLVRLDFSTPLYYTTAPYDITYNSNLYLSNTIISDIPSIAETLEIKPNSISLTFDGTPENIHALMLGDYVGVDVFIYVYIPSINGGYLKWQGVIDKPSSTEDVKKGKSTVTWKIANHWSTWKDKNSRLITHEDQQRLFPTDDGLEFYGVTNVIGQWWGGLIFNNRAIHRTSGEIISLNEHNRLLKVYDPDDPNAINFEKIALPVIYGEVEMQGIPVFRDVVLGAITFQYLHVVYLLAEGECDSLTDILFFEDRVSYTHASLSPYISVTFHSGTDAQVADAALVAASTHWTSNHKLSGMCYVHIRYTKPSAAATMNVPWRGSGEPEPTFRFKGKKLYDPRDATTTYSTNPALVLYDYLTSTRYGKGLAAADLEGIEEAADYCEVQAYDHSNVPTQSLIDRFEFKGVIDTGETIKKNVEHLLFTMIGHLPWSNGKYKLVIERLDDPVKYRFTEDNIKKSFTVDHSDKANIIYYKYIELALDKPEDTVTVEDAAYLTADNNRVLKKSYSNPFEQNRYRAINRATTILKKSRQNIFIGLTASHMDADQLAPGDVIAITRSTQGWSDKKFRIEDMRITEEGDAVITRATEYEPSVYDWAIGTEYTPASNTNYADPLTVAAPTSLVLASGTTNQVTADDGTARCRIKVSFTASITATVQRYIVEYQEFSDTDWIRLPDLIGRTSNVMFIDAVLTDVNYTVRVTAVNDIGVQSSALSGNHTVSGQTSIGIESALIATDGYNNSSIFFRTVFDSIDGGQYLDAVIGGGGIVVERLTQPSSYLRAFPTSAFNPLTFSKSRKLKYIANVSGIANLSTSTREIACSVGVTSTSQTVGGGFSIVYKRNFTTGQIDVYVRTQANGAVGTETFICVLTDAEEHTAEVVFNTGVNCIFTIFAASLSGGSATLTQTVTLPTGTTGAGSVVRISGASLDLNAKITVYEWMMFQEG